MNGRTWRIALCTAMLEYGEAQVTGEQIAQIANAMFPAQAFQAWPDDAELELREFRKHLKFVRAAPPNTGPAPTLYQQLEWALTIQLRPTHPIVRQFVAFLNRHECRNLQLREMVHVREPAFAKPGPASRPKRRIYSERRGYSDAYTAWGASPGQSNEGFHK